MTQERAIAVLNQLSVLEPLKFYCTDIESGPSEDKVPVTNGKTEPCRCGQSKKVLPETDILEDNSNASVGCDCPNCGDSCNTWFCWPCAWYDQDLEQIGSAQAVQENVILCTSCGNTLFAEIINDL